MRPYPIKDIALKLAIAKSQIETDDRICGQVTIRAEIKGGLHSEGCTAAFEVILGGGSSVKYNSYSIKGTDLQECVGEVMLRYRRDLAQEPLLLKQEEMPRTEMSRRVKDHGDAVEAGLNEDEALPF